MSEISAKRVAVFQRRFPGRTILSLDELYHQHFGGDALPRPDCDEVLTLLANELAMPVGLLRPNDKMAEILEPAHSGNPLRWIEEWTRAADGKSELNDRIRRRLSEKGTLDDWRELPTVGDVVRAWCGRMP
jgi:hypothetical protein